LPERRRNTSRYSVGYAGIRIEIEDGWYVLDVGSGHNPNARADVLLERSVTDHTDRAGGPVDITDPRLVIGDAAAMPFATGSFDYVIASHVAEHVNDPLQFCSELSRVAHAGYIETPGWFGDMVLREDYHRWRIRRRGVGLEFLEVGGSRPFGRAGEAFYSLLYFDTVRPVIGRCGSSTRSVDLP
jgi:SAM-dependent methyltransferase